MNAWVCFKCPAHGPTSSGLLKRFEHAADHPTHPVSVVWAKDSHRWSTIHGYHCRDAAHLALYKEARRG